LSRPPPFVKVFFVAAGSRAAADSTKRAEAVVWGAGSGGSGGAAFTREFVAIVAGDFCGDEILVQQLHGAGGCGGSYFRLGTGRGEECAAFAGMGMRPGLM